jgi:hypothetical protein
MTGDRGRWTGESNPNEVLRSEFLSPVPRPRLSAVEVFELEHWIGAEHLG